MMVGLSVASAMLHESARLSAFCDVWCKNGCKKAALDFECSAGPGFAEASGRTADRKKGLLLPQPAPVPYFPLAAFHFFHRARCAAPIFARAAFDILRLRLPL